MARHLINSLVAPVMEDSALCMTFGITLTPVKTESVGSIWMDEICYNYPACDRRPRVSIAWKDESFTVPLSVTDKHLK